MPKNYFIPFTILCISAFYGQEYAVGNIKDELKKESKCCYQEESAGHYNKIHRPDGDKIFKSHNCSQPERSRTCLYKYSL